MNFFRRNNYVYNRKWNFVRYSSNKRNVKSSNHSEFALTYQKEKFMHKFMRRKIYWCNKVNSLPTIEQRLVELNMPKLFKYTVPYFEDKEIPFNGLEYLKFVTRTHVEPNLPLEFYSEDLYVDEICKELEDEVKEIILTELDEKRNQMGQVFNNLNMLITRKLRKNSSHLKDSSTDFNVKIDAFWFLGHSDVGRDLKEFLKLVHQDACTWNTDRPLRAHLEPHLVLRTRMPLNNATDLDGSLSCGQKIKWCHFSPIQPGFKSEKKRAVILPGYFPGVTNEHGHLFFYDMESIKEFKHKYGDAYLGIAHQQRAVLAGFVQAYSHAFFLGATPFRDPERPVTQQTVFSDGKFWVFSVYQLNTCNFSLERGTNYTHNNVLWLKEPIQLFDKIENNKVVGYNSEVLKTLIKMYLKETVVVPEPEGMRFIMNHDASKEFKNLFYKHFLKLMSEEKYYGRKEKCIAMWENIYKIWNNTRPQDAKRKFYDVPWRRMPSHLMKISDLYPIRILTKLRAHREIKRFPRLNTRTLLRYDHVSFRKTVKFRKKAHLLHECDGLLKTERIGDAYLLRDY